jgi:virginiamycin A acetyltransferase
LVHPLPGYDLTYVRPTVSLPGIEVGPFTYFAGADFQDHVTNHVGYLGDRLIIGKFCQIAIGVEFVMNGANHQMNAATTFPFYAFGGWDQQPPPLDWLPFKGDTVVGNDVWIGQHATILPGVQVADGALIGANAVVGSDVEPYTIVVGNPARPLRQRLDQDLIELLLELKWWDLPIAQINRLIPVLTSPDLDMVSRELRRELATRRSTSG